MVIYEYEIRGTLNLFIYNSHVMYYLQWPYSF